MRIESAQNQHVKLAQSLHTAKGRREAGLFLAEGPRVVSELLMYGRGIEWIASCPELGEGEGKELADAGGQAGIPVHEMDERAFRALSDARTPQGIAAVVRIQPWDLASLHVPSGVCVLLVLHELRDPGNLGSMIRAASAFAAGAVILTADCADPYMPKAVRSSAGALFHLPIVEADWAQVVRWSADAKVSLVAADVEAEHVLGKAGLPQRAAIVIGNEAHGLPAEVLQEVALRVRIPMPGRAESLNAAAAAAILLYETSRHGHNQRCNSDDGEK